MTDAELKALIDPILAVFGGADGGVGFTTLRFVVCQQLIDNPDGYAEKQLTEVIARFSRLCQACLEKNDDPL
jgi:hypothetical protein